MNLLRGSHPISICSTIPTFVWPQGLQADEIQRLVFDCNLHAIRVSPASLHLLTDTAGKVLSVVSTASLQELRARARARARASPNSLVNFRMYTITVSVQQVCLQKHAVDVQPRGEGAGAPLWICHSTPHPFP